LRRREFLTAGAGSILFRGLWGGARVPAKGPLRAFPANPRYFTDGSGRAVYGTRDNGYYKSDPPAWDGRKVSVLDTDHLRGHGGTAPWVWKSFLRGYNTLLMDSWEPIAGRACPEVNWGPRPGYPGRDLNRGDDPTWDPVRQALGNTRQYSLRTNLAACAPADYLASTHFCLANPGKQYLAYLPEGDAVTLDLSGARGMLECEWMHPTAGTLTAGGTVEGGGRRIFPSPLIGPSALYVWQT
jgi:hypothetical protein